MRSTLVVINTHHMPIFKTRLVGTNKVTIIRSKKDIISAYSWIFKEEVEIIKQNIILKTILLF